MKILIVGGGGREHAVAWKLRKENNRKVIQNLYQSGYNIKEIAQLTKNSIFTILRYLKLNKSVKI